MQAGFGTKLRNAGKKLNRASQQLHRQFYSHDSQELASAFMSSGLDLKEPVSGEVPANLSQVWSRPDAGHTSACSHLQEGLAVHKSDIMI
jgi:hypothetical protein